MVVVSNGGKFQLAPVGLHRKDEGADGRTKNGLDHAGWPVSSATH